MKQAIYFLIAIFILVLIAGVGSKQIRETYDNINTVSNKEQKCMDGCNPPEKLYGNCSNKIEKDSDGNCYKTCPYECNDSSPYSNCRYDTQCMGCGFKKFRINCDGSINPEWSDNTSLDDQSNLDNINQPNPLQQYDSSGPQDENQSNQDMATSKDGKKGSITQPGDFVTENINDTPYINPEESMEDLSKIQPGCCGDIHFHYYNVNSNPSGNSLDSMIRSGGMIENRLQNGIQNAVDYQNNLQNSSDYNSAYNYGAPGTQFPTDEQGQISQYRVKYEDRPSVTGLFDDTGPLGANIGQYGTHIKGCNCPPGGSDISN